MADPTKLRLHKALTSALQQITVSNGYRTELGNNVFRGRNRFGETDPLPMVSILENPEQPESRASNYSGKSLEVNSLIIQGFTKDEFANPTDPAHDLMADVIKVIALEKRKVEEGTGLGEVGIKDIRVGQYVVRPSDEVSSEAYGYVFVDVEFVNDMIDG